MNAGAHIAFAVSEHAIVNVIMSRKRNAFDDRGGNDRDKEKRKCDQEEDGEGSGGFEQHGD